MDLVDLFKAAAVAGASFALAGPLLVLAIVLLVLVVFGVILTYAYAHDTVVKYWRRWHGNRSFRKPRFR